MSGVIYKTFMIILETGDNGLEMIAKAVWNNKSGTFQGYWDYSQSSTHAEELKEMDVANYTGDRKKSCEFRINHPKLKELQKILLKA